MSSKIWIILIACAVCLSLLTGNVMAQDSLFQAVLANGKPAGKLSFRLQALADIPALRTATAEARGRALSLPAQGPGSLTRDAAGKILVYIRMTDISADQIRALQDAGAQITHISDRYMTVTAMVDPAQLSAVASLTAVKSLLEALSPEFRSTCPMGVAVSEGYTQLNVDLARANFGLYGDGVQVGVLSDSYDKNTTAVTHADGDVTGGDLPGGTNTCGYTTAVNSALDYSSSATDEGRGMTQIVHDLAPGATKRFATANGGVFVFANNIRSLRAAGADIIVDDVFYYLEPYFQDGPVNVAISDVVSSGALYFTSAGNGNLATGSSYEAPSYRPTACPTVVANYASYLDCHNFEPSGGTNALSGITLGHSSPNSCSIIVDFQWNEPWDGISTDLDIFLLDSTGSTIVASSHNRNITTGLPYEYFTHTNPSTTTNESLNIVIARFNTGTPGTPRLKYVFMQNGNTCIQSVHYNTSSGGDIVGPSLNGHSATRDGFSVAAVPYSNPAAPETYTAHGPATHYYGPVTGTYPSSPPASAITPVAFLPDFAATDGGCTSFFGGKDNNIATPCYRFYGTSAAAPHAAAVTALLKERANSYTEPMVLTPMVTKYVLQSTARAVAGGDINSVGAGLIDANAAINKLDNYGPVIRVQGRTIAGDYSLVQTAYDNSAASGDVIEMVGIEGGFTENLVFNGGKNVTLRGGYDWGYSAQDYETIVHGTLLIRNSKVTIDWLVIQ